MATTTKEVEQKTGEVYGELWHHFNDRLYRESVELFDKRWRANGESPDFFIGKRCLDVGCGGGRYSVAMAIHGAASVTGVDVSESGLKDAQRRVADLQLDQISFRQASVLDLPFPDGHFDFVMCSGVLHHTVSISRGLAELYRVVKPGGSVYLLLYGDGGFYWSLNRMMRPYAELMGHAGVSRCISAAGLAANKRRTVLDSLFCPILETYTQEQVAYQLKAAGFPRWRSWQNARLDHESDPATMLRELAMYVNLWRSGEAAAEDQMEASIASTLGDICQSALDGGRSLTQLHERGQLTDDQLQEAVIGNGHFRIIAERPKQ